MGNVLFMLPRNILLVRMFVMVGSALNATGAGWLTSRDALINEEELEERARFTALNVILCDLERHSDARSHNKDGCLQNNNLLED